MPRLLWLASRSRTHESPPRLPLPPPMTMLDDLVRELRLEMAGELPIRLHARVQSEPTADGEPNYGHMTGLPFARQFDRFLSGNHGGDFLADDCIEAIRDWCRVEHWREAHSGDDPFAWNLCARIVIAFVQLGQPLTFIASPEAEDLDVWLVRRLLTDALVWGKRWREDRKAGVRISDESRLELDESEALPIVLAREHSIEHERKVWGLWRERFPFIRSWEAELERRRAYHAVHCHERCTLLMGEAA